jgi:hypothetical protein
MKAGEAMELLLIVAITAEQFEFKMLPGVYEWKTWRKGRDTARGALTVTSNCLMQQIYY